jgi:endonuclease/exonuclease/phosphatase family metal-dependent hydrolase
MRPLQYTLLAAALLVTTGCAEGSTASPQVSESLSPPANPGQALTVYTQNLFLGGDTGPLFTLDLSNTAAVVAATQVFWQDVKASDIPSRMAAIAREIEVRRPHLVGLQEAVQFAVLDMTAGGSVIDGADLLAELQREIKARQLPYELAATQINTVVTLPLSPTTVLRAVERIAVLRRIDVPATSIAQGTYAAFVPLGPFSVKRGWIRVSTSHQGVLYHFVTTHLETQSVRSVQALQAQELIEVVTSGLNGVTIVAGDLNSDASNPGAPSWTPTHAAMLGAGFIDVWEQSGRSQRLTGYTCCHPDLRDREDPLEQRIDFVLVRDARRPARNATPGAFAVDIFGDDASEQTKTGLWPADHAGLLARLRLPRGLPD